MIITGIASYDPLVKRFLTSLRRHYLGKVDIFLSNISNDATTQLCKKYYASVSQFTVPESAWTNENEKLCWRWTLLKEIFKAYPEEVFLVTDIWDVYFQGFPEINIDKNEILLCSEGKLIKNCMTNFNWMTKSPYWKEEYGEKEIINAGTIIGYGNKLYDIAVKLENCEYKSGSDQSELNYYIYHNPEIKWTIDKNIWMCLFNNFGGIDGDNFILDKELESHPIVHAQGTSKKILDNLLSNDRNYAIEIKMNTILKMLKKINKKEGIF